MSDAEMRKMAEGEIDRDEKKMRMEKGMERVEEAESRLDRPLTAAVG
jgi:hypothetical protein